MALITAHLRPRDASDASVVYGKLRVTERASSIPRSPLLYIYVPVVEAADNRLVTTRAACYTDFSSLFDEYLAPAGPSHYIY